MIIRHGTVIDGSGNPRFDADVGDPQRLHRGDRRSSPATADARDRRPRALRRARVHQHPQSRVARRAADRREHADAGRDHRDLQRRRQRAARHRAADEDAGRCPDSPSTSAATSASTPSWQAVVGNTDRRPTAEEIERMRALIATGLDQGAWGVSAGLDYKPGYFATHRGSDQGRRRRAAGAHQLHQSRSHHARVELQLEGRHRRDRGDRREGGPRAGRHAHEGAGPRAGHRRRSCSRRWRRRPGAGTTPRRTRIRIWPGRPVSAR